MNECTVCRVGAVTATIAILMRDGLVKKTADGRYLTTGAHPHVPHEVPPPAPQARPINPYSPLGLRLRGYQVMEGKTAKDHRVMIGGGYYRITAARENGLI